MKKIKPEVKKKLKKTVILVVLVIASDFIDMLPESTLSMILKIVIYIAMAYLLINLLKSISNVE